MDARLALRTSEERARALHGRADGLLRAARQEREARAKARERHERLVREGKAAEAVGVGVAAVLEHLDVSIDTAAKARDEVEQSRAEREQQRSEEHTSELQSPMRRPYAVFCLKK